MCIAKVIHWLISKIENIIYSDPIYVGTTYHLTEFILLDNTLVGYGFIFLPRSCRAGAKGIN